MLLYKFFLQTGYDPMGLHHPSPVQLTKLNLSLELVILDGATSTICSYSGYQAALESDLFPVHNTNQLWSS